MNHNRFLKSYSFKVDFILPGLLLKEVSFTKIEGLQYSISENNTEDPNASTLSAGEVSYSNLTLTRAIETGKPKILGVLENSLTNWVEKQVDLKMKFPIPIVVHALNEKNKPAMSWTFYNAFPIDYSVSGFDSTSNELVTETFIFKYKEFKRKAFSWLDMKGFG